VDLLGSTIAGLAPALFWLAWVRSHDRAAPEPLHLVLLTFALGALSTLLVLGVRPSLEDLLPSGVGLDRAFADAFLLTAPLEESAKALALIYALGHRACDERLDGVVYGAAAGLGFASVENIVLVWREADPGLAFVRGFTATVLHLGTTAVLGYLLATAKLARPGRVRALPALAALLVAIVLHGSYDLFLFVDRGLGWISLLGVLPLLLVLLAWKVRRAKRLWQPTSTATE
jgi:RsiW-degrading membrane proteinase PrsW (M82 family)